MIIVEVCQLDEQFIAHPCHSKSYKTLDGEQYCKSLGNDVTKAD